MPIIPEQLDLLRRIDSGTKSFQPESFTDEARKLFDELVERLIDLEERGLIRGVKPKRDFQSADYTYTIVIISDGLTLNGRIELNASEDNGPDLQAGHNSNRSDEAGVQKHTYLLAGIWMFFATLLILFGAMRKEKAADIEKKVIALEDGIIKREIKKEKKRKKKEEKKKATVLVHDNDTVFQLLMKRLQNNWIIAIAMVVGVVSMALIAFWNQISPFFPRSELVRVQATAHGIKCFTCVEPPRIFDLNGVGDTELVHSNQHGGWYCQLFPRDEVKAVIQTENGKFESWSNAKKVGDVATAVVTENPHYKLDCLILGR